jgi:DNA-directed RNA polymerase subunit M/transcription elongation factor TFIIS
MGNRSGSDPEYDFFRCNTCGHMWVVKKTPKPHS